MNQTEQVFLSLLRDYVCGQKLKALPTVDWQALYNLAQSHNVTGLVGRILADLPTDHCPPKALAVAFRQGMGQTLMAYEKRMVAVQVMEQTLTDAHIPYLTVKGACTAAAYPDPSLRRAPARSGTDFRTAWLCQKSDPRRCGDAYPAWV